jgi:hypothetical protein
MSERTDALAVSTEANRKPRKFERLNTADPDVVVVLDVDHAD